MYLKRLELVGFKSFASKTTIDLPGGITAIVGPNGSGKSNVIDAIRWLLGERDAKNIRGGKAEDLIFAGTPQRARVGMAQATITFDNSSKFFPVDFEEVAITRRVTRDGISQYFLNGAEIRLRDVIDFFAKSRLGTKGFTIINQGSSDLFVRVTPKERRAMIEEILGLRQFQLKKHEAERKLKNTGFNTEKAQAMIDELLPRLRLLKRQTAKWENYEEIKNKLRELEAQYFGQKLFEIEVENQKIAPELGVFDGDIAAKEKELKILQAELAKIEASQPSSAKASEGKAQLKNLLEKRAVIQRDLGRVEAQIEFLLSQPKTSAKASDLSSALEKVRAIIAGSLNLDIEAIRRALNDAVQTIDSALGADASAETAKAKEELVAAKEKLLADLTQIDQEFKELEKAESQLSSQLRDFNDIFRQAFEAVEKKKQEMREIEAKKSRLLFEKERTAIRLSELERQASQNGLQLKEFKAMEFSGSVEDLERKVFRARAEIASIGEIDESLIKESKEVEERHNFLSQQLADLHKAAADLGQLIKDLDEKIHHDFERALKNINEQFTTHFAAMFGGGKARLTLLKDEAPKPSAEEGEVAGEGAPSVAEVMEGEGSDEDSDHPIDHGGIDIEINIPRKKISGLEMLSGGEKSLVSIAVLFALISVSPPPFLVLDEVDAALDERNSQRFATLVRDFAKQTQFIIVTHNRSTMESADILYGVTMGDDGTSKVLSVKLD